MVYVNLTLDTYLKEVMEDFGQTKIGEWGNKQLMQSAKTL